MKYLIVIKQKLKAWLELACSVELKHSLWLRVSKFLPCSRRLSAEPGAVRVDDVPAQSSLWPAEALCKALKIKRKKNKKKGYILFLYPSVHLQRVR